MKVRSRAAAPPIAGASRNSAADVEAGRTVGDLAAAVGSNQPFYLPYQGQNDRELQQKYGALVCKVIADKYPAAPMPPPPAPGEKIRVGIVSGLFRHHTVWKLMIRGWLSQLDRNKFEIFGYHTNGDRDSQTEIAVKQCTRFVQGPLPGERWREEILADRPHILLYPDIGMDPASGWIAANRLAPTQCMTWGHPNTSGYPTMDYFLTSAMMEPRDGDQHYSERLIRLPNLSIYYEPIELNLPAITREQLGIRPSAVAYWSGQSLFKYLPQYDQVFARIAREVPESQFLFIQSTHGDGMTTRLQAAGSSAPLRCMDSMRKSIASSCRAWAWTNSSPPSANAMWFSTASDGRAATPRLKAWPWTRRL